ncbi:MAG: 3-hydroxybutyryl-CoA dehydrogenase [Acidobacteria bacterium 13_1_40CM_2_68_10]|nr:MAG: 3-hydroxybutyryl-CoA dehydrogenase [Acidobacteria bacterium 13_1_40CM_2_68_10]OLE65027.1 MAG: 3-hydroxybutyryl-CoA dehydrogenase [Acidobacteria bacterium 13_1_20CM_2_68_14]
MPIQDPSTIGVVGAGQMGRGIAQVAAQSGFAVLLHDQDVKVLDLALRSIDAGLKHQVEKGKLEESVRTQVIGRVRVAVEPEALSSADFTIEAISEDRALKTRVFAALDRICRPDVILASNTSSLSITQIAASTRRADRIIGMHFMNPVPVMELVEIVAGQSTSRETIETTQRLAKTFGKTPVAAQDYPGFISNRILMPMINEAIYALHEGVGSRDDIDTVMRLGMRHPMGPLALADFIGLDTCLAILQVLHEGFGDPKYRPCPLLRRMVDAGLLGKKSGRGFYQYGAGGIPT